MTEDIRNIVEDLVNQMNCEITGVIDNTIAKNTFCSTKWARSGKILTDVDTGALFKITNVQPNQWIDAIGLSAQVFGSGTYELVKPYFISGTKLATNSEWSKVSPNLMDKTPLIWLLEVIRFRGFGRQSTMEFESDVRLFSLDVTNVTQYYTADHRENVVYPMEQLAMEFINTIGRNRNFKTIEDYEMITFSRFGVERDQGMFQNILDANLSGVELRITLEKFKKNCIC